MPPTSGSGLITRDRDSVRIDVSVPGWRWEIEFMADGSIDIERYRSVAGVENDPKVIEDLFVSE
jgi:hypothetical protein